MLLMQGRVYAASAGEAAVKVREKWGGNGKLVVKDIWPGVWYEFVCQIGCYGEEGDMDSCQFCGTPVELVDRVNYDNTYWHQRCLYDYLKRVMPDSPLLKQLRWNLGVTE